MTACAQCSAEVAELDPVMYSVRGARLADRVFCDDSCLAAWSRTEVVRLTQETARLRGWLRAIARGGWRRGRGYLADLAGLALTGLTVEGYLGRRDTSCPPPPSH